MILRTLAIIMVFVLGPAASAMAQDNCEALTREADRLKDGADRLQITGLDRIKRENDMLRRQQYALRIHPMCDDKEMKSYIACYDRYNLERKNSCRLLLGESADSLSEEQLVTRCEDKYKKLIETNISQQRKLAGDILELRRKTVEASERALDCIRGELLGLYPG